MSDRRQDEHDTNPPAGQGNRGKAPVVNYMEPNDANYYASRKDSNPEYKDSAGYAPVTLAPSGFERGPALPPLGIASEPAAQTYAGGGGYGYTGHTQHPPSLPAWEPPAIKVRPVDPIPASAPPELTYTYTALQAAPPPGGPSKPLEELNRNKERNALDCFKNAYARQKPEKLTQLATDIGLSDTSTIERITAQLLERDLHWLRQKIERREVMSVEETIDVWEWETFGTESARGRMQRLRSRK